MGQNSSKLRAVIYTRVSTEDQAEEGTSLSTQLTECLKKAEQIGAEIVEHCEDAGISGALLLKRTGILKAILLIEGGKANVLIAYDIARYSRDAEHQQAIKKRIEAAGGRLIFCTQNFENNADGDLMFNMLSGFADWERRKIKERTGKGRRAMAEKGIQPQRSRSPFGYHIVSKEDVIRGEYPSDKIGRYIVLKEQSVWVRQIFDRYASGDSLARICRWLNDAGLPTPRNGQYWRESTIKWILEHPVYKGTPVYGRRETRHDESRVLQGFKEPFVIRRAPEEKHVPLTCEAIVSEETWEECNLRMKTARKEHSGNPEIRHLLTGLLKCPTCDRHMIARRRSRKRNHDEYLYECRHSRPSRNPAGVVCNSKQYNAKKANYLVVDAIRKAAHSKEHFRAAVEAFKVTQVGDFSATELCRLTSEIKTLDAKEQATVESQIEAKMAGNSTAPYLAILHKIAETRRSLETRLHELEANRPATEGISPNDLAGQYAVILADVEESLTSETLTDAEKHHLVARVVDNVRPEGDGYLLNLKHIRPQNGTPTLVKMSLF